MGFEILDFVQNESQYSQLLLTDTKNTISFLTRLKSDSVQDREEKYQVKRLQACSKLQDFSKLQYFSKL